MKTRVIESAALAVVATTLLGLMASAGRVLAQTEQKPTTGGPQQDVGETILLPKKTEPAPPRPVEEKKLEKIDPREVFTLATATNLVNVDVLVLDNNNNPISSLSRKHFKVYDDGVPQTITNFATSEAPMTVCLLVEFSNKWWFALYQTLRYSYDFVRVIEPKDWVAVVTFDMNSTILQDFTQDRHEVIQALDRLRIPGFSETNLFDSLAFAIDRMKDIQGRKAIVVVCTGFDTFSKLTYGEMLKISKASDTAIYPISILEYMTVRNYAREGIDAMQARNQLNYIAKYSGGQAYFPRFEQDLPGIYGQIAEQLRRQYSLGFVPSNANRDGKFHQLKVELIDEMGNPLKITDQKGKKVKYRVVAREGYYEPKS